MLPFLDLQYLYGLARAERPEAQVLLHNIQTHALQAQASPVWQQVALPAALGLLAHAQGDHATAARELGSALPRMLEIGGSHAQRDLFEQIHLDALIRSRQWVGAQHLAQQRAAHQPQSVRLQGQATGLLHRLGLSAACAAAR